MKRSFVYLGIALYPPDSVGRIIGLVHARLFS